MISIRKSLEYGKNFTLLAPITALVLSLTSRDVAIAAIPLGPFGPTTVSFDAAPDSADWLTRLEWPGEERFAAMDVAGLDAQIQTINLGRIADPLPQSTTFPPSISGAARYNGQGHFLQTYPTLTTASVLMAILENTTGLGVRDVEVSYDLGLYVDPGETLAEQIPGHRVYYSKTGSVNSWVPVTNAEIPGRVTFNVPVNTWGLNDRLYVL